LFDLGDFILSLIAIVVLAVLVFFVLPALVFLVQLVIFLVLLCVTLLLRILFRRPWIVDAIREGDASRRLEWDVVGWWRGRQVMVEIAQGISHGHSHIQPAGARAVPPAGPGTIP
jgi:hypothetical protein